MVEPYFSISVVGNSKNAGKTTVLNFLLETNEKRIGLTSIGLDGEDLDALSFLPKPKITPKAGMIVATAKDTLQNTQATYRILEETFLSSALGNIVIIEIITAGTCLIGGPSSIQEMKWLIEKMKSYAIEQVFIDGAFFRLSLSSISDACIYVVGANYHLQMEQVVRHFAMTMKLFHLEQTQYALEKEENIMFIETDGNTIRLPISSLLDEDIIWAKLTLQTKAIWIPGVITPTFISQWLKLRQKKNVELIIRDATHVVIPDNLLERMMRQHHFIQVVKKIPIAAVCYNPTSPKGYDFNDEAFYQALLKQTNIPLFNVRKEDCDE